MKFLTILLAGMIFMASCTKTNDPEMGVGIRVINLSPSDFDTIRFEVAIDEQHTQELIFTDVDQGDKSSYRYVDQIYYMHYGNPEDIVFFSNAFYGHSNEGILFATGFGFCGTGLIYEKTSEGICHVIITNTDPDNRLMFIEQTISFD
jgi:hypothetical protein